MPLSVALERHPELVEPHLGTVVAADTDAFTQANARNWQGGAFVFVPRGIVVEQPIVLTTVSAGDHTILHRRVLVVLEEGAEAEVWEQHLSAGPDAETVLNTTVELVVGQNARLRYVCAQDLNERSWIFGSQRAEVARDGALDWVALGFGSARGRVRMETMLAGEGSEGKVTGAYAPHARQHVDFDTTQEHAAPNTTSDLAFRGILADRSTAVWRGMIKVDPGRPADRRLPGVPQPPAHAARARRRHPRAGDPRQRRALHARGGDRPARPRAALLPAQPRTARGPRHPPGDRGLHAGAARALPRGSAARGARRRPRATLSLVLG
jgi:hypothetical protein